MKAGSENFSLSDRLGHGPGSVGHVSGLSLAWQWPLSAKPGSAIVGSNSLFVEWVVLCFFSSFFSSTMLGRLFALAACALPLASALPKIHAKGKYLYDESGNRFYIKVRRSYPC